MDTYDVVLGPAAKRFILGSGSWYNRDALAECLREELQDGPNAAVSYRLVLKEKMYFALPLSHSGIVAIYRPLTGDELHRQGEKRRRRVARPCYFVIDFLLPTSAIYLRGPGLS